jgi:ketohexokinase
LQQLGEAEDNAHLIFLGTLPARNSSATRTITNSLNGIDLRHCVYREECYEAASSYIIKSEQKDSRTIVNYNELPEMTVDEFVRAAGNIVAGIDGSRNGRVWFHFEVRFSRFFGSYSSCML